MQPKRPKDLDKPRPMGKPDRRERLLVVVAVVVAVALLGWYIADYLYVRSLPVGLDYDYTYRVDVDNVSTEYSLLLPVPVLDNGVVLPALGPIGVGGGDSEVTETERGVALSVTGTEGLLLIEDGAFDARNTAPDHRDDGTPILSMSSMDHNWEEWRGNDVQSAWLYSDVDGLEVVVLFTSIGKSWRTEDGTFTSGYVRGGWGYTLYLGATTQAGWHEYPVEIHWVEVE